LRALLAPHAATPGGLLPALHAVQDSAGYIDPTVIPEIADIFNLGEAEVYGVVTFYKDFRTEPRHGPLVQVCRAEACQARGGRAVWDAAQAAAGAGSGVEVDVDEVFCLGNCALGPTVAIDGHLHARVDPAQVPALLRTPTSPISVAPWPAIGHGATENGGVVPCVRVYVPRDAAARAVGADEVAAALATPAGVEVVRNGSRGMLWLEPLVEVVTGAGRVAYGPVTAADVPGLLAAGMLDGADHPLRLGPVEDVPWLRRQQRVTFARVGVIDPLDPDDYEAHGGLAGLRRALSMVPAAVVADVVDSGLRGRGGAAFPAGIKWRTVLDAPGPTKFIVCNADEGDSGTFADRMLMEGDPFCLLEGMVIAGWAVGAHEGYVYVRSEYPDAIAVLREAIDVATARGWLGEDVLGSGFAFHVQVRVGAGAYICGEETALLESLEGRRGVVRAKPPLPAIAGLWGRPTVVNNVLSLATVPAILAEGGAAAYAALGTGRSRGTQVFQLAGDIARGGIVETAFGVTVRELVDDFGGGTSSGRPVRAIQVGGPLGAYLPDAQLDLPMDYEAFAAEGAMVGHGGIVVFDDTVDMAAQARFAMEFCALESCGKCTPCRIGSTRGVELVDKIVAGVEREQNLDTLVDLCEVMADASLCAMGGLTPMPVRSVLRHFPGDLGLPAPVREGAQR
jgi:formate dehydrogenase iron-sulfur subunit